MADKSAIGKELPAFTWEVERGKIRELVKAIGDPNPIYSDKDAAMEEGYADVVAPPTFPTVPTLWTGIGMEAVKALKIDFSRVLHGEESYEYYGEIYPGDVLTGRSKIIDIKTKSGKSGDMDIVTRECVYTNQRNELVLKSITIAIERK
ncbi:MAG: MaoC family dehydratase N-terminal domain-containing protein [Desulfomonile tiedjei]|nr:MaoC family dehydratase N-terminal domain-containing protein [Desulfomonile tiedjei]